jgi:hypothetical protein
MMFWKKTTQVKMNKLIFPYWSCEILSRHLLLMFSNHATNTYAWGDNNPWNATNTFPSQNHIWSLWKFKCPSFMCQRLIKDPFSSKNNDASYLLIIILYKPFNLCWLLVTHILLEFSMSTQHFFLTKDDVTSFCLLWSPLTKSFFCVFRG